MPGLRVLLVGLVSIALGACAHVRPEAAENCLIHAYPLLVSPNHPKFIGQLVPPDQATPPGKPETFQEKVAAIAGSARTQGRSAIDVLVLSGGSQHGLFGTGFLIGAGDKVPDYTIVTGISTGALQSSFAFLAHHPVHLRDYPADTGAFVTDLHKDTSYLQDLGLSSSITRERTILKKRPFGLLGGIVSGSRGSLAPLHDRLLQLIDEATLDAIAAEGSKGRFLFVGVTDLDDGQGYALDMVQLARDSIRNRGAYRQCFADALIASSSVPLAAEPVTLRILDESTGDEFEHLFIDGGARYSVFARQVVDAISVSGMPVNFDVIVNGFLYSEDWRDGNGNRVEKWDAVNLALRAVDILENQVSRFSLDAVERLASAGSLYRYRLAFIDHARSDAFTYRIPGYEAPEERTCFDWTEEDRLRDNPLEFHARYMACLLAYGRERGKAQDWDLELPAKP
jgi:predicted acylesterase/phospholipase RssA